MKVIDYLQSVKKMMEGDSLPHIKYRTIESLILDKGKSFTYKVLPDDIENGVPRECFANAFRLASERNLIYVEGFSTPKTIAFPMHHGWCVDNEGNVVDNTWTGDLAGIEYYGIPFKRSYVYQTAHKTQHYGVLGMFNRKIMEHTGQKILEEAIYQFKGEPHGKQ